MSFSMASLLVHNEHVPLAAREALLAAQEHAEGERDRTVALLKSAAEILHRETGLGCMDARELVGLRSEDCLG